MHIRLAKTEEDINLAQSLRYKIWSQELNVKFNSECEQEKRDIDEYDYFSDHLLIFDNDILIGTTRLLRQENAEKNKGFFSSKDFDLDSLFKKLSNKNFLELERVCTEPSYRNKHVIELLYKGLLSYINHYKITAAIGRPSFFTVDAESISLQLNFIFNNANVQGDLNVKALPGREVLFTRRELDASETKKALFSLPPLIRGFLNFGTRFCTSAVYDHELGMIDLLGIATDEFDFDERYVKHFWNKKYETEIPVDLFS